jgi:hypothetical protein
MLGSRVVLACIASTVICGCAKLPEYRDPPITTAEVIRNVRCELRDAIGSDPQNQWLLADKTRGWNVKLNFTFEVNHIGDLSTGDNTWTFPMNQLATFSLMFTAGVRGTGTRSENIEFDQSLKKLSNDRELHCPEGHGGRYARLGGYLGIADLLERATLSRSDAYNDYTKLAYSLEFVISKSGGLTPRFNLIPIGKEKTFTGSARWVGSNADTHKLQITFSPPGDPCSVISDGQAWPDSRCPTPFYEVSARRACHTLQRDQCASLDYCVLIGPQGKEECAPGCELLTSQQQCAARNDCRWNQAAKSCDTRQPDRVRAMRSRSAPATLAPALDSSGVTPLDRALLDNKANRSSLESIESELRRQRIGN